MKTYCEICESEVNATKTGMADSICDACGSLIKVAEDLIQPGATQDLKEGPIDTLALPPGILWQSQAGQNLMEILEQISQTPTRRYRLGSMLGKGAMGRIVRAGDKDLAREVAMKFMQHPERASPAALRRFIREAQITARLKHTNIVSVYELGLNEEDHLFYTMEQVEGQTLKNILDGLRARDPAHQKAYPLPRLLNLFAMVGSAMEHAHRRGIIHRDLKPENIMVTEDGEVQVLDWGLATFIDQDDGELFANASELLATDPMQAFCSGNGKVVGTPLYMSPEQARGNELDARSDIYTLGTLLHEILGLEYSVDGTTSDEVIENIKANRTRPLVASSPHGKGALPKPLTAIAAKAMAHHPDQRYQQVSALLGDLDLVQRGFAAKAEQAGFAQRAALFFKRNKAVSTISLGLFSIILLLAVRSQFLLHSLTQEEQARLTQAHASAPAFFAAAKKLLPDQQFDAALVNVEQALKYDPSIQEALLLHAYLLAERNDFEAAVNSARFAGSNQPAFHFLKQIQTGDTAAIRELAEQADDDGYHSLSSALFANLGVVSESPTTEQLDRWRKQLDAVRPGLGALLRTNQGELHLHLGNGVNLTSLNGLRGIRLNVLNTGDLLKGDLPDNTLSLEPLRGMPLRSFSSRAAITDLEPIVSPSLKVVDCPFNPRANTCNWEVLEGLMLDAFTLHRGYFPRKLKVRKLNIVSHLLDDYTWFDEVEGLQEVRFVNTDWKEYPKYKLDSLTRIPTLHDIRVDREVRISRETIDIRPEVPSVDLAKLEALLGGIKNETELTEWWRHHWALMHYLLTVRQGGEAERPDSPLIMQVGDQMWALCHSLFWMKPHYCDYLGISPASIHSQAERDAANHLLAQLKLSQSTPSIVLNTRRADDHYEWFDGSEWNADFMNVPPNARHARRLLLSGNTCTKQGSGANFRLYSWPVGGPEPRNLKQFIEEWYPVYPPLEHEGKWYSVQGRPVSYAAAKEIAKVYGAKLATLGEITLNPTLRDEIKKTTGDTTISLWVGGEKRQADPAMAWAKQGVSEPNQVSCNERLGFILEWNKAEDVPELKPAAARGFQKVRVFQGREYFIGRKESTWLRAWHESERLGGELACAETAEELRFIRDKFVGHKGLWIGGYPWGATDEIPHGHWRWLSTKKAVDLPREAWKVDVDVWNAGSRLTLLARDGLGIAPAETPLPFLVERPVRQAPAPMP